MTPDYPLKGGRGMTEDNNWNGCAWGLLVAAFLWVIIFLVAAVILKAIR